MDVHEILYTISKSFRTKIELYLKKQKEKSNMNSVIKGQNTKWHYSHNNLSFLFLLVYFELSSKNSRKCEHPSCKHLQILS
jgi:hypothetical protein